MAFGFSEELAKPATSCVDLNESRSADEASFESKQQHAA
jgi:hypothetical protein